VGRIHGEVKLSFIKPRLLRSADVSSIHVNTVQRNDTPLTAVNFTFLRESIYHEPSEMVRMAGVPNVAGRKRHSKARTASDAVDASRNDTSAPGDGDKASKQMSAVVPAEINKKRKSTLSAAAGDNKPVCILSRNHILHDMRTVAVSGYRRLSVCVSRGIMWLCCAFFDQLFCIGAMASVCLLHYVAVCVSGYNTSA